MRGAFRLPSVLATFAFVVEAACRPSPRPNQPANAVVAAASAAELRFEGLFRLIGTRHVRSIDELLSLLPNSLRSRYVLIYASRSLQNASYHDPRVLLYTRDAKFVVAYNGASAEDGYRTLETMEFDDRARAFYFRELTFPAEGADSDRAVVSEPNPPRCRVCHGDDPHPVWDSYPTWPGAYGEEDRARHPGAAERAGFSDFLAHRSESPRYRLLLNPDALGAAPLRDDAAAYEGRDTTSRNAEFGMLLQKLAYQAIARRVVASPRFARFRYALLASLDPQCVELAGFIPDAERAKFSRRPSDFENETNLANAAEKSAKERRMHSPSDTVVPLGRETLAPFRYLVEEGLGVSTGEWTLALEKFTYDFTTWRRSTAVLERVILEVIARTDPTIRALREGEHRDTYCATLRRRSREELGTRPIGSRVASDAGWIRLVP
jgi:hypothetical protein